jgi:hypothetical protein
VSVASTGETVRVGVDETLPSALGRAGVHASYACQQDFCGTCRTDGGGSGVNVGLVAVGDFAVAVIGANCSPVGSTATMADGATAYCSTLQTTGTSIWSLNPGDVPSPTVTAAPTEAPLPIEEDSPVRVCMQQTGRTRLAYREEIRRSNLGLP